MTADNQQERLNPHWITGFIDGEGCFMIQINKNHKMKTGYQILPEFRLVQHIRDRKLLEKIAKYFGFGVVRKNSSRVKTTLEWRVRGRRDLKNLCDHLTKYPLRTKKLLDFLKFRTVLKMMDNCPDITKIRNIKSTMNKGSQI